MQTVKLPKDANIPTTKGRFYFVAQESTKQAADAVIKKLGKPKAQTLLVKYEIPQSKSFLEWILNQKAETKILFVVYTKN